MSSVLPLKRSRLYYPALSALKLVQDGDKKYLTDDTPTFIGETTVARNMAMYRPINQSQFVTWLSYINVLMKNNLKKYCHSELYVVANVAAYLMERINWMPSVAISKQDKSRYKCCVVRNMNVEPIVWEVRVHDKSNNMHIMDTQTIDAGPQLGHHELKTITLTESMTWVGLTSSFICAGGWCMWYERHKNMRCDCLV